MTECITETQIYDPEAASAAQALAAKYDGQRRDIEESIARMAGTDMIEKKRVVIQADGESRSLSIREYAVWLMEEAEQQREIRDRAGGLTAAQGIPDEGEYPAPVPAVQPPAYPNYPA
jgi:hypothetical protein